MTAPTIGSPPPQAPGVALPIEQIGPQPIGIGHIPVVSIRPEDKTKVEGEKATPAPMVPPDIQMSPEAERRLAYYLEYELSQASAERWQFMNKLARLKEKFKAKFPEFPKDWPIANASQLIVPIIKTNVNTLGARIYQTVMAAEPLASVRTTDNQFQDFAFDFETFLATYSDEKLNMAELLDGWVTEVIKLGTGILEVTTRLDRRTGTTYDNITGKYENRTEDLYNGPIVYHVPLEDFWIRPAYRDLQTAPWCGKEVRLTWSQIKDMAMSGELNPDKINNIWRWVGQADLDTPRPMLKQEELEQLRPTNRQLYNLFELCVRWDFNGDGLDEEAIVYFHRPSRTVLRKKFSGFRQRPWRVGRFMLQEHWFYGEGLAEMLEHLQEEISTMHNQRIDNATLANIRPILVARLIQGLRPGDRIWSGKIIKVQNVKEDVGTLQLGDVYPSTVMAENIANQYAERLSGVGEVAAGQAKPVSRTTATAQLALLEELNRRFDKVVKGLRRTLRDVYRDLGDLFFLSGTNGLAEVWLGSVRGRQLESFLAMPADLLRRKVSIQIRATSSTVNKEVEFQTQIAVFNLIISMWQQIRAEASQLAPTIIPLLSHEILKAIIPVFKKIMQYSGAPDPDQAISVLTVLENILPSPEDMGGMGAAQQDQASAALEGLANQVRTKLGGPQAPEGANGNRGMAPPGPGAPAGNTGQPGVPLLSATP